MSIQIQNLQFLHFNPNPKVIIFLIKKPKTHGSSCSSNKAKLFLINIDKLHLISWLIKICLLGIQCLKHLSKTLLMFAAFHLDWIVNPLSKVDLDFKSHFCVRFRLDIQSKKFGLSKSLDAYYHALFMFRLPSQIFLSFFTFYHFCNF